MQSILEELSLLGWVEDGAEELPASLAQTPSLRVLQGVLMWVDGKEKEWYDHMSDFTSSSVTLKEYETALQYLEMCSLCGPPAMDRGEGLQSFLHSIKVQYQIARARWHLGEREYAIRTMRQISLQFSNNAELWAALDSRSKDDMSVLLGLAQLQLGRWMAISNFPMSDVVSCLEASRTALCEISDSDVVMIDVDVAEPWNERKKSDTGRLQSEVYYQMGRCQEKAFRNMFSQLEASGDHK